MDANSRNLYLFGAFCLFGFGLCQTDVHLLCSPHEWIAGETVTLQCSLLKSSYPNKCATFTDNTVSFRRGIDENALKDVCTVSGIPGSCNSSGTCTCDLSTNATYYNFQYQFKANNDSIGYWDCSVPCFDGLTPLTSSKYDCDNRKVIVERPEKEWTEFSEVNISLGVLGGAFGVCIAVSTLIALLVFLTWMFLCVIRVIVCVDTETKRAILHSDTTKKMLQDFVSEHFALHCCCCCCCSWLGGCCLGGCLAGSMLRRKKCNDNNVEGGICASSECCSIGCARCKSYVQNVEVEVHDIEDNQVLFLITLKSPLSWYSEAEDMPDKIKEYIRKEILKEHGKEQGPTSKPSMYLNVGPDPRKEPPADYPPGSVKPSNNSERPTNGRNSVTAM